MHDYGFNRSADAVRQKRQTLAAISAPVIEKPPTANRSLDEIITSRIAEFKRKEAHAKGKQDGIRVTMPDGKPYALCFFGDPHVDDSGSSLARLIADAGVVKATEGAHAINMGDLTNNWCPPLARLYGVQEATSDEAVELMGWLLDLVPWLVVILGNHDKWSLTAELLCRERGIVSVSHGAEFDFRAGDSVCRVDARHTHRGNSQYNPAFAQGKQNYRGSRSNIIIGAHTHTSAYTVLKNGVSGNLSHCVRVGAYKMYDEYADAHGFSPDCIGPFWMAVVDPSRDGQDPGFIVPFWDAKQGCDYLTRLREKAALGLLQ